MYTNKFEVHKLKRELRRNGTVWSVSRKSRNDYGEPTGDYETVGNITGLYHEENSAIVLSQVDTTVLRTEKQPMLLCLFSDYERVAPMVGDRLLCVDSGKVYDFTGAVDIQDWGLITDISMELVDTGVET